MVVKEFITKLGFNVDHAKFRTFDRKLGQSMALVQKHTRNIRGLATSVRNTSAMLAIAVTAPIALLGIKALKTASDLEQMDIAFTTMLGSAEKSQQLIKELLTFTAKTPFDIKGVQQNAKLLLGMGIESEKIIPTLTALGNVAAGLSVPLERIALNYGQVRTQTRLTGAELRDFSRAGVPLIAQLAKQLSTNEANVKKMVSSGKVSFKIVEEAFMSMSGEGGKFFNLMEKQSKSLGGRWANLMDIMTIMGAEFGKMIEDTFNLKENLRKLTDFIESFTLRLKNASPFMRKLIILFTTAVALLPVVVFLLSSAALAIIAIKFAVLQLAPILTLIGKVGAAGIGILAIKILAIIALIVALSAAIYIVYDDIRTWVNGGDSLIGKLLGSFTNFYNRVSFFFNLLGGVFSAFWKAITEGNQEAWNKFKVLFSQFANMLGAFIVSAGIAFIKVLVRLLSFVGLALFNIGKTLIKVGWMIVKTTFTAVKNFFKFLFNDIINSIDTLSDEVSNKLNSIFTKKFPRLARFFGVENEKPDGVASPAASFPPGVLASAGAVNNTSRQDININSKVDLTMPDGTPSEQERFLQESADAIFDTKMNTMISNAINANKQVEQ